MTNNDLLAPEGSPALEAEDAAPTPSAALTDRQWKVLNFIRETMRHRGYAPSLREICAAVGLASTSSAAYQLKQLAEKGLLARDPGRPRAYQIVGGDSETQKLPALKHVGCPLFISESSEEGTDRVVVLKVTLDPAIRQALLAGALLTVQQLSDDAKFTMLTDGAILGQVTAVTHPVGSPHNT
ncbi:winged helix DNA-binding protein [Streptomyces phaeochromogenes]|uniref:LexA family protein n=1 Tax=Streptomyces phaeochromogenes TaxID=1923 RepID=UPI002E28BAE6|nr:winged helix DNA-binding protein [Streptomyces phaeochromogenes]